MTSNLGAHADARRNRRFQAAIDALASLVIAMLAWPFPIARATLSTAEHVSLLALFCAVAHVLYMTGSIAIWQKTAGMALGGLALCTPEVGSVRRRVAWALAAALMTPLYIVAPSAACRWGYPERVSGIVVCESD